MKKMYMVLVATASIWFLPTATAFYYTPMPLEEKNTVFSLQGDHPEWADGGFVGAWGLGVNHTLGYFIGYYGHRGRLQFFAGVWNTTDNSMHGYVRGVTIGPYLLGKINLSGDNHTAAPIVGLYKANDEAFIARIMGVRGVVVAHGRYQPFE